MTTCTSPIPTPAWQPEKHLQSGDRVWILTDVECYESRYLPWSEPQELFRVGIYDLASQRIGFANFGRDIAFAMMKAGLLPAPPWKQPLPFGVALHRQPHDGEEKGRYRGRVELLEIDPVFHGIVAGAKKRFSAEGHYPGCPTGIWDDLIARASRENAIESAALKMVGPFSAGDIKRSVGKELDVTSVLRRLVEEGKLLPPTGKKRGTRYEVAPPPPSPQRLDWTG